MTHNIMQDAMAADPARATSGAGRWPDGTSTSAPPRTGAPSDEAQ